MENKSDNKNKSSEKFNNDVLNQLNLDANGTIESFLNYQTNIVANKLLILYQKVFYGKIEKISKEVIKENDPEHLIDDSILDGIDIINEFNKFKSDYVVKQNSIINNIISRFDIIKNSEELSEEKTFEDEMKFYDLDVRALEFVGPLTSCIENLSLNDKNNDEESNLESSQEILEQMAEIIKCNFYKNKVTELDEKIEDLDIKIKELEEKNKLFE